MFVLNREEAYQEAQELFPPGSLWRKTINGRRFILQLLPEGVLREWSEGQPRNSWFGTWKTTTSWAGYLGSYHPALSLTIGLRGSLVTFTDGNGVGGEEGSPDAGSFEETPPSSRVDFKIVRIPEDEFPQVLTPDVDG